MKLRLKCGGGFVLFFARRSRRLIPLLSVTFMSWDEYDRIFLLDLVRRGSRECRSSVTCCCVELYIELSGTAVIPFGVGIVKFLFYVLHDIVYPQPCGQGV